MKKLIKQFILISIIIYLFSSNIMAQPNDNQKSYYRLKESTVHLGIKKEDDWYGCTGIIIKKDAKSVGILTAQHCVDNANEIIIDEIYKVSEWITANTIDVAYLIINETIRNKGAIKISRIDISLLNSACSLGYPNQSEVFDCGQIVTVGTENIYSDIRIISGCSGSGVINRYGELIGIMHSKYSYKKSNKSIVSVATKISVIRKFLRKNNIFAEHTYLIK